MIEENRGINRIVVDLVKSIKRDFFITNLKEDTQSGKLQSLIVVSIISSLLSVPFIFISNIVTTFSQIVSNTTNIYISFTAMLLGAYAITHSLTDRSVIRVISKSEDADMLKENALIYLKYLIMHFIGIVISFILSIVLIILPEDYMLFPNRSVSTMIAIIGIFFYFFYFFMCIFAAIKFTVSIYKFYCFHNKVMAEDNETESCN
ncbi:MAG: hypothetical protein IKF58_04710 [Bacillus sp. (in: Bacteria)]|nr:hypothetical protein [Bacillus sp. (in: firmicutes)]